MASIDPSPLMRTASTEYIEVDHPTPEISALSSSVDRLERSAEELSQGGSDIGEEIRKLHLEQQASSRRSSMASISVHDSRPHSRGNLTSRSRGASTSSYNNGILDLNKEARAGGYSPAAFIGSPSLSTQSGSWSHLGNMQRSTSSARPGAVQHSAEHESPIITQAAAMRQVSLSESLKRESTYAAIEQISHDDAAEPEIQDPDADQLGSKDHHAIEAVPEQTTSASIHRTASNDTHRQASTLFHDFDGVHYSPTHEQSRDTVIQDDASILTAENVIPPRHQLSTSQSSQTLRTNARPISSAFPLPNQNMTFYPAPVPRMLNLPKRLSQLPSPTHRRSQVMNSISPERVKSTAFLPALEFQPEDDTVQESPNKTTPLHSPGHAPVRRSMLNQRRSMMSLATLPPQLRASVFFDQPTVRQDVDIQDESAVATLDSILDASATAPVNMFTDHPMAGRMPANFYKTEPTTRKNIEARKSGMLSMHEQALRNGQQRQQLPRTQSENVVGVPRRSSMMSLLTDFGGRKVNKSHRMSMSAVDDLHDAEAKQEGEDAEMVDPEGHYVDADGEELSREHDPDEHEEEEMQEEMLTQPTTLLAELQMRKVQQKSRNRTAATAFPNGMHSTLLELDAVAQIEKRKRKNNRVALAWEEQPIEPEEEHDDDGDVPLGVLYNPNKGLPASMSKPVLGRSVGLMERRQIEESEPLSKRRNRILGIDTRPGMSRTSTYTQFSPAKSSAEDDDIPLAERARRIKQKESLNAALGDISTNRQSTFSEDLISQLGGQPKSAKSTASSRDKGSENARPDSANEEETLGQRRARLQREQSTSDARPALRTTRSSSSMANLLAANPLGRQASNVYTAHRSASISPGGLLSEASRLQAAGKEQLRQQNLRTNSGNHPHHAQQRASMGPRRTSSQTLNQFRGSGDDAQMNQMQKQQFQAQQMYSQQQINPLAYQNFVGAPPGAASVAMPGMINGAAMNGHSNAYGQIGTGGMSIGFGQIGMGQMAGMGGYNSAQMQQMQMQMQMMGMGTGMNASNGMGVGVGNGMGMTQGQAAQKGLVNGPEPAQRALIDRWRSSVAY